MIRIYNRVRYALTVLFFSALITSGVVLPGNTINVVTSAQAAVASSISVRGNERIDDEVVISYLTISPGERYNDFDIDASVKALFTTGLFSDVSIYGDGSVLIVEVDENSTVNKVIFEGNSRIKDDALKSVVRLQPQSVYSDEQAGADVERIELAYGRVGRRDAQISFEVIPLSNSRVNVIYRVNEGDKTKISRIDFIGNVTFPDRRLLDVISTKESTIFSFLTSNDIYDQSRVNADEEALRRFYFNKGFADFQILSTTADLNDADNEYNITFTIDEGPRYTFGNILIDSTISGVDSETLYPLLETEAGEHYSAKEVEDSIVAITERVAENGYAFAEVVPRGNRNFESNTIDVTYLVDEGARVYIEDIQILGNDRTRDYVIRREFDMSEGDAYNRVLVQKTRRKIQGLGFFEAVDISTRPGSGPDRVVLIVKVIEKSTGDISLSGGYSSNGGASGEISFTERNLLGRGQFLRVALRSGDDEESYSFQFNEPFFLGYKMSAGIDLSTTESDSTDERQYAVDSNAVVLTAGIPLTENLRSSLFYTYQQNDVTVQPSFLDNDGDTVNTISGNNNNVQGDSNAELSSALVAGLGDFTKSGFGYSFVYNTLDSSKSPREGLRAALSQTVYGAGGDAQYFSTEASVASYWTVSEEEDIVLFGRVRAGHMEAFGNDNGTIAGGFRTIDNFQARSNSIRGFDSFGYGPRDPLTGDPLGGRSYWNATAEVLFPMPFIPRSLGLRAGLFADVGQLTDVGNSAITAVTATALASPNGALTPAQQAQLDDDALRASFGASLLWNSPFGPLRVDYSFATTQEDYDDEQEFNFGVSTAF